MSVNQKTEASGDLNNDPARPAKPSAKEKPDCSNHKKDLFGEKHMPMAARAIADLHYETLAELFDCLIHEFHHDAVKDAEGGRYNLAGCLENLSGIMRQAFEQSETTWEISKPFMEQRQ